MKIFHTAEEVGRHYLNSHTGKPGFVPTMGALHEGHLSLVREAVSRHPMMAVSIFVNPTQFNDPEDLKKYPRNLASDLKMLGEIMRDNDFVFVPEVSEIYPEKDRRIFDFGGLDKVMEGLHRPGHFNGVAQVVTRLFDIVKPSEAFFGQKDFQQLTIIRAFSRQLYPEIKISACPIVREKDGLAMSSRNMRLLPEHRERAGEIYRTISQAAAMVPGAGLQEVKRFVADSINSIPGFTLEYFEIADDVDLHPLADIGEMTDNKRYYCCIALYAGQIRLIDNTEIRL